jgi:hypothetical protein
VRMLSRLCMAAGLPALVAATLALPTAAGPAAAQTGTNLIPAQTSTLANPGDTGLWQAWYGDTVAQSTAQVYPGDTGSLAISPTAAIIGVNWSDYPGVTGAQPDTPYTLSYALYGPAGAAFTMEFNWYDSNGDLLRTDDLSATTDGSWVNPDETVITPAGTSTLYVQLTSGSAATGDTYYLDAITALQETTSGNVVTVTNPGSQTGNVGTGPLLQIQASDSASGQTLSYSASGLPPGLAINSATGEITGKPTKAGTYTVTATATDGTGASGSATFTWIIGARVGGRCTTPVWNDTSANDVNTDTYSGDSPYVLAMDMWNGTYSPIRQTMGVCNQASWYVADKTTSATNTAVLVYPNVQENYSSPISDYGSITSAFASSSTSPGDYEFSYDIWLNSYANEVMIWTHNHGQTPGGTLVASDVTISGLPWDVYATSGNGYVAFVPAGGASYQSGTFNLLAFFNYLMGNGQIAATSTLTQIDYGVEICNTGGVRGRFNFTNFAINTSN